MWWTGSPDTPPYRYATVNLKYVTGGTVPIYLRNNSQRLTSKLDQDSTSSLSYTTKPVPFPQPCLVISLIVLCTNFHACIFNKVCELSTMTYHRVMTLRKNLSQVRIRLSKYCIARGLESIPTWNQFSQPELEFLKNLWGLGTE